MEERDILIQFKDGVLDRGQAVRLLTGGAGPVPDVLSAPTPDRPEASGRATARDSVPDAPSTPAAAAHPAGPGRAPVDDRYAVVGIAGRYPLAPDLGTFWDNVREGRETATEGPYRRPWGTVLGTGERGHFVDRAADFDPEFFGLTPDEGRLMDPQERLFLETAWEALEDAGCTGARLDALTGPSRQPRSVGVFVGVATADYALLAAQSWPRWGRTPPHSGHWSLAGRLSRLLGLNGPGQALDAAEASGLVALHHAVGALRRGECSAAVAGGVELLLHPSRGRDGVGEGVGAVVLKPLARALADGDRVHAVVRETAVVPVPAPAEGLHETREATLRRIGDAGAATGIAALTSAVLQLRHAILAPTRDGTEAAPWPRPADADGRALPRVATVEVRVPGGPAARAVLEDYPGDGFPYDDPADADAGHDELVLLSAPTPAHLTATAASLADWLDAAVDRGRLRPRTGLAELARALRAGRADLPCRLALTAHGLRQLADKLRQFASQGGQELPTGADRACSDGSRAHAADVRAGAADPYGLGEVPETRDYLAALWRGGRTEQLTRLWLGGLDIDWAALERRPGGAAPVALPPPTFLRRPLWLGDAGEAGRTDATERAG
ncbi:polyketide synthase [Streptomyces monashensis]|uniref:Ketosynthase family 3 (KS3) domain-containing protein n=1 Tax=Streptomyces monashensis TaxID=1678012 RepID=A0A1S2QIL6_9ACTN|nr:polyketide synthase [Streptomyces monashensis]OIK06009.1 hypothetical protein BIV23_09955 [Streptomyces monashensis]